MENITKGKERVGKPDGGTGSQADAWIDKERAGGKKNSTIEEVGTDREEGRDLEAWGMQNGAGRDWDAEGWDMAPGAWDLLQLLLLGPPREFTIQILPPSLSFSLL